MFINLKRLSVMARSGENVDKDPLYFDGIRNLVEIWTKSIDKWGDFIENKTGTVSYNCVIILSKLIIKFPLIFYLPSHI